MAQEDPFLRPARMTAIQLYVPTDIARDSVMALGELGLVQFRDLNDDSSAFLRPYTTDIRRLDDVERQLRFFAEQMNKAHISYPKYDLDEHNMPRPSIAGISELAEHSAIIEQRVTQLNESYEELKKREIDLTEWRCVLREAGSFFDRAHGDVDAIQNADNDDAPLLQDDVEQHHRAADVQPSFSGMNIGFVAGVINRDRVGSFERVLWRVLRGNLYMNQAEIDDTLVDPHTNEIVPKNVFVIFAHGREILAKIRRISETLGADLYSVDENSDLRRDQLHSVNTELSDVQNVLSLTQAALQAELVQVARSLSAWMVVVTKEKAIYHTLNLFAHDKARHLLVAEGWCPQGDLQRIRAALHDVSHSSGQSISTIVSELQTSKTPPTYLRTTKYTEAFQTIVNAYGTATYGEINPAIPVFVTFPFLFAVMFGDVGHAFIMLAAASAMIYWEKAAKKIKFELFSMVFYGRYIAFVMAVFSIFTGLIYNDIFSRSMHFWQSAWKWTIPDSGYEEGTSLEAELRGDYRYPFGIDPAWHGTENNLLFTNSLKMKMSIILGWAHMTFSLCFSYFNARHFRKPIDIWGNFVPGMIFFQSIFGYLVVCIIYKWAVDWNNPADPRPAPGLLNMLIFMFLQPGTVDVPLYRGQATVQKILVLLAVVQVPILLLLKPFYLRWENNRSKKRGYHALGERSQLVVDGTERVSSESVNEGVPMLTEDISHGEHEEFEFSEVMIHQIIHTIEFCLNCISHTASYLRLWALSLAHQQLSVVVWNMILAKAFNPSGFIGYLMLIVMPPFWFACSCVILVGMEGTSAMLHSLRLAWVESFSKFAEFNGWPFVPFSLNLIVEETEGLKEYLA
jgi:V-type H+-transporting ATPase subunit a